MCIGMQLLLGHFLPATVAAWSVLAIFVKEARPGVQRVTEGTLVDTATLLVELARPNLFSGDPTHGQLAQTFNQLQYHSFHANTGGINKMYNEYHAYMIDAQDKVLLDSMNKAVGQDYSHWNDVWLTLHGQYGACSTLQNPADPESPVMYVVAPIMDGSRPIGVLSVDKPNTAMTPVIKHSERRILWASAILLRIALVIDAGIIWWISCSIARLTRCADSVTDNKPAPLPGLGSSELRKLVQALESMRVELEGENYTKQYVHALTHELKSPLAAIRGAAKILREGPLPEVVARLTDNILTQNTRMQVLVETLLRQVRLENRQEVVLTVVDVAALFCYINEARAVQLAGKSITLHVMSIKVNVTSEPALLEQALGNLLDNAVDSISESGRIALSAEMDQEYAALKVLDIGSGIPNYALSYIFERFYSLSCTDGQKSSGLGLVFVSEVARLSSGGVTLRNVQEGDVLAPPRLHRHFTQLQILPTQPSYPAAIAEEKTTLKSPLFWKMTTLFSAALLLLIPVMLIRQVIVKHADYRSDVEDVVRQGTSGPQGPVGPLIAIPMTELYMVQEDDKTVGRKRSFIHL